MCNRSDYLIDCRIVGYLSIYLNNRNGIRIQKISRLLSLEKESKYLFNKDTTNTTSTYTVTVR